MTKENIPEFTVTTLSQSIRNTLETEFEYVRVKGELGRVSRPASGHVYFDLKDDKSILASVVWRGTKLTKRDLIEEGNEVVLVGRISSFSGHSKYQIIVEDIQAAGIGALLAMLNKRREKLAAEGIFSEKRKLALPTYPLSIGVITSISGAVIKDILVIVFLLGNMFYQSWSLTLFAFFAFPLAIWPIKKIGKSIRKITYEIQNEIAKFSNVLAESIKGIRQVKAYNREEYEKKRAFATINFIKKFFIRSAFVSNRLSPLMEFIGSLAVAVSIYAGGVFVLNESMTTGQFMSFLVSLLLAYQPVKALGNLNISVQEGLAGAERIFSLLDTSLEKSEKHESSKNIKLKGNIKFNDVNFSYTKQKVLNNINLSIECGEKAAFVGLSGSGKSTLINLLLRFYDNYSGEISIDQKDIKSLSLFDLRENISLITQETLLFNESILDNIRYGNMSSSDKEIENIAEISGVSKFANQLPGKLNTVVGESGIKLSGGQRQRIAIARALIKNAPILIMEEATSSLDNLTEKEIQLALDELMKDKTTIIIAHRLSTIQNADVIFTLEKGSIESKGSHEFLLKNSAVYKKLQLQEDANEH